MKVLLTGAAGQLGQALIGRMPDGIELVASSRSGGNGLVALDLADAAACRQLVEEQRPDWVLNAGAYTAVDKAEAEPELAHAVNGGAPRAFAEAIQAHGGRMLQLSTDFVFNGQQGSPTGWIKAAIPWGSTAPARPAERRRWKSFLGPVAKVWCCAPAG